MNASLRRARKSEAFKTYGFQLNPKDFLAKPIDFNGILKEFLAKPKDFNGFLKEYLAKPMSLN